MKNLKNIHPGEVLLEEFLIPLSISAYRLAKDIGIPQTRVSEIVKGNRRITTDTALRLSKSQQSSGLDCKMTMTSKRKVKLNSKRLNQLKSSGAMQSEIKLNRAPVFVNYDFL
jgi:addiction module HigA family antidote